MKRIVFLLIFLLTVPNFSSADIIIENETSNSITLMITIEDIKEKIMTEDGNTYNFISIDQFGSHSKPGVPMLPFRAINLLTSINPDIKIEILDSEIEIREKYLIYPAQSPLWAVAGETQEIFFTKNEHLYKTDSFYPENPIVSLSTMTYRGAPITRIGISPIQFNPLTKKLKIYRMIRAKISFAPITRTRASTINIQSASMLKNIVSNPESSLRNVRAGVNDLADDIFIVTTDKFLAAAEKLAIWHRMKGYDVKIISKSLHLCWGESELKTKIGDFYNNTTTKPRYLIIIGDNEDVPSKILYACNTHGTDLYYSCIGKGYTDFMPDMASGRISANNLAGAMAIVDKIISYEKTPPTKSSFYSTALGCAYFQDTGEDKMPDYADRAFVQVVERINQYLKDDHNITSERIYCTKATVTPKFWNDTRFSWGEAIPEYLLRSNGFKWDGDKYDIGDGINDGAFLIYHYDHGINTGWADPAFSIDDIDYYLSNNNLLPVIFSIDCSVGAFNGNFWQEGSLYEDCFAEEIVMKKNGGAVGIIAASAISWSGQNDALLQGMIDAIWPSDKMTLKSPHKPNPTVTNHSPIYTMGDVLDQGLIRMSETWSLYPEGEKYHYELYHWFGDPTMPIWTKKPIAITTKTIANKIDILASTFSITEISCDSGIVTLYNQNNDKIIGKTSFSAGEASIPIVNNGNNGDTIIITITSHNNIPLVKKIIAYDITKIDNLAKSNFNKIIIDKNKIAINKIGLQKGNIAIFSLKGKLIKKYEIPANVNKFIITLDKNIFTNGVYIATVNIGNFSKRDKFNIAR